MPAEPRGWGIRPAAVLLLGVMLAIGGCSADPAPDERPEDPDGAAGVSEHVESIAGPLRLVREEYRDAVRDGNVVDTGEYRESRMFAEEARRAWRTLRDTVAERLDPGTLERMDRGFDDLIALVEERGSIAREERLVDGLLDRLGSLDEGEKAGPLRGVVQSIRRADRDIQAERSLGGYRLGVAIVEPVDLYRGEEVVSPSTRSSRQVRVLVRQKRTKRPVPGAVVQAQWLDTGGTPVTESEPVLPEVWGPYLFYGANVNVPPRAARLRVTVNPPRTGRHAGMKEILVRSVQATFDVHRAGDTPRVAGPEPAPVAEDYEPGSDVSMGLGEALLFRDADPYRIGFIAEHAEPFWYPVDRADTAQALAFRLADYPEEANRHLEALVLERGTNRIVPGAGVRLRLEPEGEGEPHRFELPFLLAAFHHYGNSVVLPPGRYEGRITVRRPELLTLEPGYFPEQRRVNFSWRTEDAGEEPETHTP